WWNDPDCIMLRDPLTVDNGRAWASFVAISGQLNLVSESLPDLPRERLDIYKRSIPNAGISGRPVDLFDRERPRTWQLTWGEGAERRDVVAMFNWTAPKAKAADGQALEEPVNPDNAGMTTADEGTKAVLDPAKLGLAVDQEYIGFDYWNNQFIA